MNGDDLLERCRLGERAAWNALIDRFSGYVYAIARAHGLDESTCDDVAQTVFASLARSLQSIRNTQALPGWISTTARRECWRVSAQRRRASRAVSPDISVEPAILQRLESIEQAQRVRQALHELGGRCEQLLTALFISNPEPDYQQVARRLDLPVGSIGPTRARCLAKLALLLKEPDRSL